jgi:SnoaL-like domain
MGTVTRVGMLEARDALIDVQHRYAQAWDNRDPGLLRAAMHPDAALYLGERLGWLEGIDAIIAAAELVWERAVRLHHWMANPLLEIDLVAGTATGTTALDCVATYVDTGATHVAGRYLDEYTRVAGVWKISKRRYEVHARTPMPDWAPVQGTEARILPT